ncbi:hypothetical protein DMN91_003459 [Ooceraea biroi]|uniref:Uncharacterized protein n=1 Tax=Ooceraea biroi TaxID=2015173 RepID=A0A3L8DSF1_OOCBI|nr:collagen alpha-1(I) chain-like [Ooceraea biroi]RLU23256.1 hypothetical protein DMN91_003459 [Ooceraea biroi]
MDHLETVGKVTKKSGHLQGPYVKALREAAADVRAAFTVIAERRGVGAPPIGEENAALKREVESLRSQISMLRETISLMGRAKAATSSRGGDACDGGESQWVAPTPSWGTRDRGQRLRLGAPGPRRSDSVLRPPRGRGKALQPIGRTPWPPWRLKLWPPWGPWSRGGGGTLGEARQGRRAETITASRSGGVRRHGEEEEEEKDGQEGGRWGERGPARPQPPSGVTAAQSSGGQPGQPGSGHRREGAAVVEGGRQEGKVNHPATGLCG